MKLMLRKHPSMQVTLRIKYFPEDEKEKEQTEMAKLSYTKRKKLYSYVTIIKEDCFVVCIKIGNKSNMYLNIFLSLMLPQPTTTKC